MGRRATAIRWTLRQASTEFRADSKTISAKLKAQSAEPGKDGKYSTAQIAGAIYGDINYERQRKIKEDADARALQNQARRGELVEAVMATKLWQQIILTARQRILGMGAKLESQYFKGMEQSELRHLIEIETRQMLEDLSKPIDYSKLIDANRPGERGDGSMETATSPED